MAKAAKEPKLKEYTCVFGVNHDGVRYKPGKTIKMPEEQAEPLVRRGTLVEIGESKVEPKADMADPTLGGYKEDENAAKIITDDPAGRHEQDVQDESDESAEV